MFFKVCMKRNNIIKLSFFNALMPVSSLSFAWYLQLYQQVIPCSLCLLQRWGMYLSLLFIFLSIFTSYFKLYKTSIGLMIFSVVGNIFSLIMALRNVWLQTLPEDKIPACGLDIENLLEVVPFLDAIKQTFQGSGDCAQKAWIFLGQSLAVWASLFFTLYLILQIIIIYKIIKNRHE